MRRTSLPVRHTLISASRRSNSAKTASNAVPAAASPAVHAVRRLVEPFCGGLAVTLGLSPGRALLNDANPQLINFYRWLQKGLCVDLRMANEETLFYGHRERFNRLLESGKGESPEAAALF